MMTMVAGTGGLRNSTHCCQRLALSPRPLPVRGCIDCITTITTCRQDKPDIGVWTFDDFMMDVSVLVLRCSRCVDVLLLVYWWCADVLICSFVTLCVDGLVSVDVLMQIIVVFMCWSVDVWLHWLIDANEARGKFNDLESFVQRKLKSAKEFVETLSVFWWTGKFKQLFSRPFPTDGTLKKRDQSFNGWGAPQHLSSTSLHTNLKYEKPSIVYLRFWMDRVLRPQAVNQPPPPNWCPHTLQISLARDEKNESAN